MGLFLVNLIHLGPLSPISVYFGPFGLFLSNLIYFSFFRSNLVHFDPLWSIPSILVQFDPFRSVQSTLVLFGPFLYTSVHWFYFGPLWSFSVQFSPLLQFGPFGLFKNGKRQVWVESMVKTEMAKELEKGLIFSFYSKTS